MLTDINQNNLCRWTHFCHNIFRNLIEQQSLRMLSTNWAKPLIDAHLVTYSNFVIQIASVDTVSYVVRLLQSSINKVLCNDCWRIKLSSFSADLMYIIAQVSTCLTFLNSFNNTVLMPVHIYTIAQKGSSHIVSKRVQLKCDWGKALTRNLFKEGFLYFFSLPPFYLFSLLPFPFPLRSFRHKAVIGSR